MGIGASVNSSVTDETTIDTSSTTDTSVEKTVSNSISNTYVEPGYKIKVQMMYQNQKISLPYTFPVSVSGTAKYTDKWGNAWSYGAGDNIQYQLIMARRVPHT